MNGEITPKTAARGASPVQERGAASCANERMTENIVRDSMKESLKETPGATIWEQSSQNQSIQDCLKSASKFGRGAGRPEFIVGFEKDQDFLIVVECKANAADHEGDLRSAIGGAQHYAKHLSRKYNVLAIAVSGTDRASLRVSHFWHFKGDDQFDSDPAFGAKLLPLGDYLKGYNQHPRVVNRAMGDMLLFTKDLNARMHALSVLSPDRSLLVSAILMALEDKGFAQSYASRTSAQTLLRDIKNTMLENMKSAGLHPSTYDAIAKSYDFIDEPSKTVKLREGRVLVDLVRDIYESAHSFNRTHEYHDMLGHLYVEFLRYSNSDKGLGIVLTPPHITQLAMELVRVLPDDVVYDNCAGTGGFLVSAMKKMVADAKGDQKKIEKIKSKGLVGVEFQSNIAALLGSNMFIHGDGRSNVIQGDCFSAEVVENVQKYKPTVGFLNPPFYTSTKLNDEMEFALNNMDILQLGGRCVVLMPMQCALATSGKRLALKKEILEKHTLEGVLSLPDEIFHNSNVGVVTCMAIFTAHRPHPPGYKTWFGLCKDDGFVIKKPLGRCDFARAWEEIKKEWVQRYHNREGAFKFSTTREVTAKDDWCAEAYIDTDYSQMMDVGVPVAVREYATFLVGREIAKRLPARPEELDEYQLSSKPAAAGEVMLPPVEKWGHYPIKHLFVVSGTTTTPLPTLEAIGEGEHPYVTTQATNNGVAGHFNHCTEAGGVITVDSAVLGFSSYHSAAFSASDHVEKLTPKFEMNPHLAMFMVAALNANRFRYSYGRKASQTRLKTMTLGLPAAMDGNPDYDLMERYVRSLPFSATIS